MGPVPFVLGHEIGGRVVEAGTACRLARSAQRVAVDPCIPCAARGIDPPCANCARGWTSSCLNLDSRVSAPAARSGTPRASVADGRPGPGPRLDAPPSPRRRARSQRRASTSRFDRLPRPPSLAPERRRTRPRRRRRDHRTGHLGRAAGLYPGCPVTVLARHAHQADAATPCGADHVVTVGRRRRTSSRSWPQLAGARVVGRKRRPHADGRLPLRRRSCRAPPQSVTEALRAVAHRGTVLLLGAAGISEVDLTPIWYKEAALVGSIDHCRRRRIRPRTGRRAGPSLGRPRPRHLARRAPPRRSSSSPTNSRSTTTATPSRPPSSGAGPERSKWCSAPSPCLVEAPVHRSTGTSDEGGRRHAPGRLQPRGHPHG